MKTTIIKEEKNHMWVRCGDTLEVSYEQVYSFFGCFTRKKTSVILSHTFTKPIEIFYIGVFEIEGGGFGGYFSIESQL